MPHGAPHRAPTSIGSGSAASPLRDRHGLAGRVPHRCLERHGLGVHGRADTFVEDAPEAGFHQSAVVMHAGMLPAGFRVITRGWVTVAGDEVL